MNNLNNIELSCLTPDEAQQTNGGWWGIALAGLIYVGVYYYGYQKGYEDALNGASHKDRI